MTMDENRGSALGIRSDSMELESKEIYELHDSSRDISEANGRKNHKATDDLSVDNPSKTVDSPKKDGQNGPSHNPGDREHECLIPVEEHGNHKENKSRESSPPRHDSSCLIKGETTDSFADKKMLHTELPELEVCYKEIDQHIVKDICVDEGKPEKGGVVNESVENDKPRHFLPQTAIDKAKEESFDKELLTSEEEETSLQKNPNVVSPNQLGSEEQKDSSIGSDKEECYVEFFASEEEQNSPKIANAVSPDQCGSEEQKNDRIDLAKEGLGKEFIASHEEEISLQKNPNIVSPDQHGSEEQHKDSRIDFVPSSEANISMTGEAATDSSEDLHLVDKKIPIAEIGTRGFIKSLLESLDGEGNVAKLWSPQIADKKSVPQSLAMALVNEEAQQEVAQCSSSPLGNNSVESGIESGRPEDVEDVKEQPVTSREAHDEQIQPGDKSQSSITNEGQTIAAPNVPKQERWTSDSASIMSRMQKDEGETSFSAASLINYSEPVPFSGSISHRSDSSATSTRSFAFPVLQSEWNSSPVRMAKADRRLRKQRRWTSGVFCCRF